MLRLLLKLNHLLLQLHDGLVLLFLALLELVELGDVVLEGWSRPGGSLVLAPIEYVHEEGGKLLGDVLPEFVPLLLVDREGLPHLEEDVLVRFDVLPEQAAFVVFHLLKLRVHLCLIARVSLVGV